jgi:hypothetical protein
MWAHENGHGWAAKKKKPENLALETDFLGGQGSVSSKSLVR